MDVPCDGRQFPQGRGYYDLSIRVLREVVSLFLWYSMIDGEKSDTIL